MPKRTIYVRDEDQDLWRRAEELAGEESLSGLLATALRRYVEAKEAEGRGMERIELSFRTNDGQGYRKAFTGRWLVGPSDDNRYGADAGACYGVAQTRGGKIAVYVYHVNDGFAPELRVYDDFEGAESDGVSEELLAIAAKEAGEDYVEELDI